VLFDFESGVGAGEGTTTYAGARLSAWPTFTDDANVKTLLARCDGRPKASSTRANDEDVRKQYFHAVTSINHGDCHRPGVF
jgi:hypothetical protein